MASNQRQFPADRETLQDQFFMDLLYSYFQAKSLWTTKPGDPRYLLKRNVDKEEIYQLLGIGKTTYYARLKVLKEKGFIIEDSKKYILPVLPAGKFYLIPKDLLLYFINTSNENLVKVYTILGRMFSIWDLKGKPRNQPVYFTLGYLAKGIGYSNAKSKSVRLKIIEMLNFLELHGLISYEIKIDHDGIKPYQYRVLKNVRKQIDKTQNTLKSLENIDIPERLPY